MSKIICDMCGTAYPETSQQCPICGCAKGENPQLVADDTPAEISVEGTRTPVKGGRFSKANVRKRNKAQAAAVMASGASAPKRKEQRKEPKHTQEESSNKGLMIVVLVLLLAIIAVVGFVIIRYFLPDDWGKTEKPDTTTTAPNHPEDVNPPDTTLLTIPCEKLELTTSIIELKAINEAWLLDVTVTPGNTTDEVVFSSSDESVVKVSADGKVTAVSAGQAVVTVTCGSQEIKCRVVCNIPEETVPDETEPDETTDVTEPDENDKMLSLNREDFTLSKKGETWVLYDGVAPKNKVIFSSDDESIATFENGVVTAVAPGMTTVHAEYEGKKVSCIVRCSFPAEEGELGGTVTEGPVGTYTISHTDVTIAVGEDFTLRLVDANGKTVSVTWSVEDSTICTVSGNTVTGAASGVTEVFVTYGGTTYTCIVRVK